MHLFTYWFVQSLFIVYAIALCILVGVYHDLDPIPLQTWSIMQAMLVLCIVFTFYVHHQLKVCKFCEVGTLRYLGYRKYGVILTIGFSLSQLLYGMVLCIVFWQPRESMSILHWSLILFEFASAMILFLIVCFALCVTICFDFSAWCCGKSNHPEDLMGIDHPNQLLNTLTMACPGPSPYPPPKRIYLESLDSLNTK